MTVGELLDRLKSLPPETRLCVAEVDEAFAAEVVDVEQIDAARTSASQGEDDLESIELANGSEAVVVLRW